MGGGDDKGKDEPRRINVLATGSVDQTIKVSLGRHEAYHRGHPNMCPR